MKYVKMKYYSDYKKAHLREKQIQDNVFFCSVVLGSISIAFAFWMLFFYGT